MPRCNGRAIHFVPAYRLTYIERVRNCLQGNGAGDDTWRLVCAGTEAGIDSQGRISILNSCLRQAGVEPPQQVTILGMGYWLEVRAWTLQVEGDGP
jgi:DNA-binding transcriptional regulator/RsmH inhibitor MraZ